MKTTNKVCYLLLNIGASAWDSRVADSEGNEKIFSQKDQVQVAKKSCRKMGVKVEFIEIRDKEKNFDTQKRFVLRMPYFRKDDVKITKIIESFVFSLELFIGPSYVGNTHYCFPAELVHNGSYILASDLVALEERKRFYERISSSDLLSFGISGGQSDYINAWKFSSVVFSEENLFNAVRFLANSQQKFYIYPGELDEIIYGPNENARSSLQQNSLEESLISSFRAIEAVLGNLPTKDTKLFSKMLKIGLDPQEPVGYTDHQPLYKHIRKAEKFRNSKSAHGRSTERDITLLDMQEFQECARLVVYYGLISKTDKYWA